MCEWRIDPKDLPEGAAGLVVGEQGRLPGPGRPACPSKDPVPAGSVRSAAISGPLRSATMACASASISSCSRRT